ncbi:DUF7410 domain-containing protein [Halobaculum sp. EA56]|uniref:DUF7410 domain-containing protein n=1 Tax=Halobaculum sp. EA56 TaxID=3421648 RepID=UPI003EBF2125
MSRGDHDADPADAADADRGSDAAAAAADGDTDDADGRPRVDAATAPGAHLSADAYAVPPDATAVECPRCGRPFARERHRDLHLGRAHGDLDPDERDAYEAAVADERADIRRFRIVSLGLLVLLYFGFLFLYAVVG